MLLLLAATPAAARVPVAAPSAAPAQTATLSNSRVIYLPIARAVAPTTPPPPPNSISADLSLRPVPLEEVQRGRDISLEFRYTNTGATRISSAIFSVFYPSRLSIFDNTDLAQGDFRVNHDATRVIIQVFNVAPGETRRGRVNFFVRRDAGEGERVGLFATYDCQTIGVLCRSNLAELEVIRNDDESGGQGGTFSMAVSPDRGPPGTAHTFTGGFFSPGEDIATWLNSTTGTYPLPITTRAESNGNIRIVYGTGGLVPGFYSLVAHGRRSNTEGVGAFIVTGPGGPALAASALVSGGVALPGSSLVLPSASPAQAVGDGGVAGTVSNAAGQGVAGVPIEVRSADDTLVATARSRADGGYFVPSGLVSGQYVVTARPRQAQDVALQLYGATSSGPVTVTAPELTRNVNLILVVAGGMQGIVTGGGQPVAGVRVAALADDGSVVGVDLTDTAGVYQITGLPAGTYTVVFDPRNLLRGGSFGVGRQTGVVVAAGSITDLPFTLVASTSTGQIAGRVTDATSGAGLDDLVVIFSDEASGTVAVAHTDAAGAYSSGALPAGSYRLQFLAAFSDVLTSTRYLGEFYNGAATFAASTPVALAAGESKAGIDATLATGGSISGSVTGSGAPLADVFVVASGADGRPAAIARSDAAGAYGLRGLRAGDYTLEFITAFSLNEATRTFQGASYPTPVTVAAGAETPGISIALGVGIRIVGTVSAEDSGVGLPGVFVIVYDASTGRPVSAALSDVEGRYSSSGLSRGPYKLRYTTIFSPNPTTRSYIDEFFNNASSLATAQSVLVVDPGPRTLNVALARGGTISGRVTATGTGRGLAGVAVVARQGGQIQGVVTTDEAGAYSVPGLPSGDHTVEFITSVASEPEVRPYSGELYDNQALGGVGTPVPVVVEQDTPNINAELALAP